MSSLTIKLAQVWKTALLALLIALLASGCGKPAGKENAAPAQAKTPLFAYVGANLKDPVSELAQMYEQKTGVKVELTFNNSGSLLSQLETMKKGDIYLPGGMPFVEAAQKKGYIDEIAGTIAYHTPVIITPKGNPANISKVQDLARSGVKLLIPDKEATALGKTVFKTFDKLGITADIEKNGPVYLESPAKVVAAILMGQGNAGIVEYSNTYQNQDKLDLIEIDPAVNIVDQIPCATLTFTTQKEQAKDFLAFMKTEGPAVFAKYGFKTKS
ncbi:molybdate ABC transporter substrate-binding protein [Pelotomaculum propionicicum]|uniref:molybdate ABC transporter substrate-binding protein n=1 Tax=Pelotomaculum propionicicum TaxID=258475 RepID=UPI0010670890|nr:molybdate ABC transporter substrate-binding protein [Pelotomaculum propionicicum]